MFQGTGSDVGKSLVVAGLCRLFTNRGMTVRPFKPQNMSNNAAVTIDKTANKTRRETGDMTGEIGRAQALQARACRVPPSVHMNPVLLKPTADMGSQVVVQGEVLGNAKARDYHRMKPGLLSAVMESYENLRSEADLVLIEGAGSPAEVNLRAGDIANMGFAEAAGAPVCLVADIERGGVIASLVGSHVILPAGDRDRVKGYLINKFRGDPALFDNAHPTIREHTNWTNFGVIPYFADARKLPAEDAMALAERLPNRPGAAVKIAVPRLARIANFDDLDPLIAEPDVEVSIINDHQPLPGDADVILIPGSKATISDLKQVRANGWDIDLAAHVRRGGMVVGVCGGYQMLGRAIADPDGIEGPAETVPGLGLLNVETVLGGDKTLTAVTGTDAGAAHAFHGYEIHIGRTAGPDRERPWLRLGGAPEGAVSENGLVRGAYVHGLFAADDFRRAFLSGVREGGFAETAFEAGVDAALDALARHLAGCVDTDALLGVAGWKADKGAA